MNENLEKIENTTNDAIERVEAEADYIDAYKNFYLDCLKTGRQIEVEEEQFQDALVGLVTAVEPDEYDRLALGLRNKALAQAYQAFEKGKNS